MSKQTTPSQPATTTTTTTTTTTQTGPQQPQQPRALRDNGVFKTFVGSQWSPHQGLVSNPQPNANVRVCQIQFQTAKMDEIESNSVVEVCQRQYYTPGTQQASYFGPLDPRLGTSAKDGKCVTCSKSLVDCVGHFGHVQLELPVFHIGFMREIGRILQAICKSCSRVLLPTKEHYNYYITTAKAACNDRRRSIRINDDVLELAKRVKNCPHCDARQGQVKKITGLLKFVHDLRVKETKKDRERKLDEELSRRRVVRERYLQTQLEKRNNESNSNPDPLFPSNSSASSFNNTSMTSMTSTTTTQSYGLATSWSDELKQNVASAVRYNPEISQHLDKVLMEISPLQALKLFKNIPNDDCFMLNMNPVMNRPENLILTKLPVPPVCIRPSVSMGASGTNEDDLTIKIGEMVQTNNAIRQGFQKGLPTNNIISHWDFLQQIVSQYINSDLPGVSKTLHPTKPIRALVQRLKGKQGRFRGNLSGKRVDFSGRTVISPDPNLAIDQVGVPTRVAKILTFPEKVTRFNIQRLRTCVLNGPDTHPGANTIEWSLTGKKVNLRFAKRAQCAGQLAIGDIVERHLDDNDVVLFNRQPSLHRMSIMAHRVKVHEWRTLRFNECACIAQGTLVDLADGSRVPIEMVKPGQRVLTYGQRPELTPLLSNVPVTVSGAVTTSPTYDVSAEQTVLNVFNNGFRKCYKIILIDGTELVATPDHKILVAKPGNSTNDEIPPGGAEPGTWMTVGDLKTVIDKHSENPSVATESPFHVVRNALTTGPNRYFDANKDGQDHSTFTLAGISYCDNPEKVLALSRLVGHAYTDGHLQYVEESKTYQAYHFLGCVNDVNRIVADAKLVCPDVIASSLLRTSTCRGGDGGGGSVYRVLLGKHVANLYNQVGIPCGRKSGLPSQLPPFVSDPSTPTEVIRQFLGGFCGGDGPSPGYSVFGKNTTDNGTSDAADDATDHNQGFSDKTLLTINRVGLVTQFFKPVDDTQDALGEAKEKNSEFIRALDQTLATLIAAFSRVGVTMTTTSSFVADVRPILPDDGDCDEDMDKAIATSSIKDGKTRRINPSTFQQIPNVDSAAASVVLDPSYTPMSREELCIAAIAAWGDYESDVVEECGDNNNDNDNNNNNNNPKHDLNHSIVSDSITKLIVSKILVCQADGSIVIGDEGKLKQKLNEKNTTAIHKMYYRKNLCITLLQGENYFNQIPIHYSEEKVTKWNLFMAYRNYKLRVIRQAYSFQTDKFVNFQQFLTLCNFSWPQLGNVHQRNKANCSYSLQIERIDEVDGDVQVYDLEVENNHNFSAAGIIVHNCTPYNADFDGDEMNIHLPQTYEAKAEASELMSVLKNLVTPRHGEPLVCATQDFITGSFLITSKNRFLTRAQFIQYTTFMDDGGDMNNERLSIPPPSILKPMQLWTGKQLFSFLLSPRHAQSGHNFIPYNNGNGSANRVYHNGTGIGPNSTIEPRPGDKFFSPRLQYTPNYTIYKDLAFPSITIELRASNCKKEHCMDPNDGYIVIRNSEVMAGNITKDALGGSKKGMYYQIIRAGNDGVLSAARFLSRVAKFTSRFVQSQGFSIGIDDVTPSKELTLSKQKLIDNGYAQSLKFIEQYKQGKLQLRPGCNELETLEASLLGELSAIRSDAGQQCFDQLNILYNTPLIMAVSGSKGSKINISQMTACVGQQAISGSRIPEGFHLRTLPHFPKHSRDPNAKGFVQNSFYTGLTASEFFFHTCLAHDHQILTNLGFLFGNEINSILTAQKNEQDAEKAPLLIAQFDQSTNDISYVEPSNWTYRQLQSTESMYSITPEQELPRWKTGEIYGLQTDVYGEYPDHQTFQTNRVSLFITNNHDLWAQPLSDGQYIEENGQNLPYQKYRADALPAEFQMTGYAQSGINVAHAPIPRDEVLCIYSELGLTAPKQQSAFNHVLGYWLGNGSFDSLSGCLTFSLRNEVSHGYLDSLFSDLGFVLGVDFTRHENGPGSEKCLDFVVSRESWVVLFYKHWGIGQINSQQIRQNDLLDFDPLPAPSGALTDIKSAKWLPLWYPAFTKEESREILFGLRLANDASITNDDTGSISTTSHFFRDQLVILALHAGYSSYFTIRDSGAWVVHYTCKDSNAAPILKKSQDVQQIEGYSGYVHCVTVPTGLIITRRARLDQNNILACASRPMIIGNCGGREGLVDTAVKTAETGYMQRRLLKALEDLCVQYDRSVRTSEGNIIQFVYGDDGLDPLFMADAPLPVNFGLFWEQIRAIIQNWAKPYTTPNNRTVVLSKADPLAPPKTAIADCYATAPTSIASVIPKSTLGQFTSMHLHTHDINRTFIDWVSIVLQNPYQWSIPTSLLKQDPSFEEIQHIIHRYIPQKNITKKNKMGDSDHDDDDDDDDNNNNNNNNSDDETFIEKELVPKKRLEELLHPHTYILPDEMMIAVCGFALNPQTISLCSTRFIKSMLQYAEKECQIMKDILATPTTTTTTGPSRHGNINLLLQTRPVTSIHVNLWINGSKSKYLAAVVESGTAVGAIAGQSIGEPGTQMTLKTFHFAGVASMSITQGVPRIKEIINASKKIATPIITVPLEVTDDPRVARLVKGRIETTTLGQVAKRIEAYFTSSSCGIDIELDFDVINALQLNITYDSVLTALRTARKLKLKDYCNLRCDVYGNPIITISRLKIDATARSNNSYSCAASMLQLLHGLKHEVSKVIVQGIHTVSRAVINDEGDKQYSLIVEGYDMLSVMGTSGIRGTEVKSNHVIEIAHTLGIEAARQTIITEIKSSMDNYGLTIDMRHMSLLADIMTYRGEVLGITRFGIAKMKESTLMLASFEKTSDHLFEAALRAVGDDVKGVSESIILGKTIPVGTGILNILQQSHSTSIPTTLSYEKQVAKLTQLPAITTTSTTATTATTTPSAKDKKNQNKTRNIATLGSSGTIPAVDVYQTMGILPRIEKFITTHTNQAQQIKIAQQNITKILQEHRDLSGKRKNARNDSNKPPHIVLREQQVEYRKLLLENRPEHQLTLVERQLTGQELHMVKHVASEKVHSHLQTRSTFLQVDPFATKVPLVSTFSRRS